MGFKILFCEGINRIAELARRFHVAVFVGQLHQLVVPESQQRTLYAIAGAVAAVGRLVFVENIKLKTVKRLFDDILRCQSLAEHRRHRRQHRDIFFDAVNDRFGAEGKKL